MILVIKLLNKMSDIVEWNKHVIEYINTAIRSKRIVVDGTSLHEKVWVSEEIKPSMRFPFDDQYDQLILDDKICKPTDVDTCLNKYYNDLFLQDDTFDTHNTCRDTKLQLLLDWLRRKFKNTMTNYFENIDIDGDAIVYWLLLTYDRLRCIISPNSIDDQLTNIIWKYTEMITENSRKNWIQFVLGIRDVTDVDVDWLPAKGSIYLYIVEDKDYSISGNESLFITTTHLDAIDVGTLILNKNTRSFLKGRIHEPIHKSTFIIMNSYRLFSLTKLTPLDRLKVMFVGGIIKSLWSVMLTTDADYLVSEQQEITDGSKFKPNTGVPGIYDDYGLTYYYDESLYYPENQVGYNYYQSRKYEVHGEFETRGLFPKCCSGLRIGRYVQFFKQTINRYLDSVAVHSLDDVVFDPFLHFSVFGMKFMVLDFEIIRDKIKTIDLGRLSKKQMSHFYLLWNKYKSILPDNLLSLISDVVTTMNLGQLFSIKWNLYHVNSSDKYMKIVMIRRVSKRVNKLTKMLIDGAQTYLPDSETRTVTVGIQTVTYRPQLYEVAEDGYGVNQRMMENVYLTSIPKSIEGVTKLAWTIVVTPDGKVNIGMKLSQLDLQCDPLSLCNSFVLSAIVFPSQEYNAYIVYVTTGTFQTFKTIFEVHKEKDKGHHTFEEILDGYKAQHVLSFGDDIEDINKL